MYSLDSSEEIFFDDEKGLLIIEGNPNTTIQLQRQQHMMLKTLCEQAGKVMTYDSLFRTTHDEITSYLGDDQSVAHSVQTKIYEIRKALKKIGVENVDQLLATNRSIGGYELHLPSRDSNAQPRNGNQLDKTLDSSDSKTLDAQPVITGQKRKAPRNRSEQTGAFPLPDAEVNAYYQELPDALIPKDKVVRCEIIGEGRYLFEFQLSQLDYTPKFVSIAIEYWEDVDLRKYLASHDEAAFSFDVNNIEGVLTGLTVEFKTGELRRTFRKVSLDFVDGENHACIPLTCIDVAPLSRVAEICFVIHPHEMRLSDGMVTVGNIRIEHDKTIILESELGQ